MTRDRRRLRRGFSLSLTALLSMGTAALADDPVIRAGKVTERIQCTDTPEQSYAAYVPSGYPGEKRWPVLIVMDPRGRGARALELFREGAERRGYLLIGSYNTASDSPGSPNEVALRALLPDIERRFELDTNRLYLAGFSGTARVIWAIAPSLKDHLAGFIGFGAGLPGGFVDGGGEFLKPFFGGAGTTDFNYDEVWELDQLLDEKGLPHRIRYYERGHSWPPPAVGTAALDWMEIQAIRAGLRPRDDALLDELWTGRLEEARKLAALGKAWLARRRYAELVEDFEGLRDVAAAAEPAAKLSADKAVRDEDQHRRKLAIRQMAYLEKHQEFLYRFAQSETPMPVFQSLQELDIRALQRRAGNKKNHLEALGAQRSLELVFVYATFYQPRAYLQEDDPARAEAALRLGEIIKPGNPRICYGLASVHARTGKIKDALEELRCAVEAGIVPRELLESDPDLAPLRETEAYRQLLQTLDPR